jgi:hypothetical protein
MPDSTPTGSAASVPISDPAARSEPTSGTALCLSGGGYCGYAIAGTALRSRVDPTLADRAGYRSPEVGASCG